jgi:hypothetical protein
VNSTLPDEESTSAELRRIDFTGTMWFGAALIGTSIPLAGLLSSGWRPSDLPDGPATVLWWLGAALSVLGMAGLAWAGCPVFAFPLDQTDRQKAFTIRAGLGAYAVGAALSTIVVLVAPPG